MMSGRRKLTSVCTMHQCAIMAAGALCWILLLFVNSASRSHTESHYHKSVEQSVSSRYDIHSRTLKAEITVLMSRPAHDWQRFYRTVIQSHFASAPCQCSCDAVSNRSLCPSPLHPLLGDLSVSVNHAITLKPHPDPMTLQADHALPGGHWSPSNCRSKDRLAVVIPFRDRWDQLKVLLAVLHPMLQRQGVCYRIFVVEQYGGGAFNKGRLNNAGFLEAAKRFRFDCVIFQDADIVPLNDKNLYSCPRSIPRHMAVAVDVHKFRLPYNALVGGVIAFDAEKYVRVNGYSNLYWGWGLEDDDMELRMKVGTRLRYSRPSKLVARYKALPHRPQRIFSLQGSRRKPLLSTVVRRYRHDGLSTVKYKVMSERLESAYTHLIIFVGKQPSDFDDE